MGEIKYLIKELCLGCIKNSETPSTNLPPPNFLKKYAKGLIDISPKEINYVYVDMHSLYFD